MGGGRAWGGSFDPDSHPASRGRSSRAGGREIESATAAAAATVGGGGSAKSTDGGVTRWCFSGSALTTSGSQHRVARF